MFEKRRHVATLRKQTRNDESKEKRCSPTDRGTNTAAAAPDRGIYAAAAAAMHIYSRAAAAAASNFLII